MGFGNWAEPIIGSLLGMGSGWIGSFVASSSVEPAQKDDILTLRKLNAEGKWLLILETPSGTELPWQFLQEVNPIQIMRFSDQ